MRAWMLAELPPGACAQVRDVARRFALVAFAGELATGWGILPWEEGSGRVAARSMMRRWLNARGGIGSSEDAQTLEAVRAFLLTAGPARFVALAKGGNNRWEEVARDRPVANRAGWRRPDGDGGEEFLIEPSVWKVECAKLGLDPATAVRALRDKGHLRLGEGKHLGPKERIPGVGNPRVYCIKGSIFDSAAENSGAA